MAKKKPQTITEKAIEQYRLNQAASEHSLSSYFPTNDIETANPTRGKRSTIPTIDESRKAKRNSAARMGKCQSLNDPEVALKALDDQHVLFGTSSQLVREKSPTILQNVQRAMRASTKSGDVQKAQQIGNITESPSIETSFVPSLRPTKNLWSAASRDSNGSLLEASSINSSNPPTFKLVDGSVD